MVKFISCFQNKTKPPPLLIRLTTNLFEKRNLQRNNSIRWSSIHVLERNTTEGSFSRTKRASSWTVPGFPSPRQFQLRQFMASGRAGVQLLPISLLKCHPEQPSYGRSHWVYYELGQAFSFFLEKCLGLQMGVGAWGGILSLITQWWNYGLLQADRKSVV